MIQIIRKRKEVSFQLNILLLIKVSVLLVLSPIAIPVIIGAGIDAPRAYNALNNPRPRSLSRSSGDLKKDTMNYIVKLKLI